MKISGNTILITGGGSGIGRALAEAFHAKGNQVIVAGRRPGALDETTAANPGMRSAVLDIEERDAIPAFRLGSPPSSRPLTSLSTTPGSCGAK